MRIKRVIENLESKGLEALLLIKQANVNYVSGFTDEASFALVTTKGNFFITDGRFYELAQNQCEGFEIINWQKIGSHFTDAVEYICKKINIKKLGFEPEIVTFDVYKSLENKLVNAELIPVSDIVEDLRYTKDEDEIKLLRKACSITDEAFSEIVEYIEPGMTENQVAAKLEYILKIKGASGPSFDTILISGTKTSLPHGKPDDKVIEDGDLITLDFGALYKGYHADMTRNLIVGEPTKKQIDLYNTVLRAQEAALESLKPGVLSSEPDSVVREIVKDYIEYYYPGIGHGVGLELYENPFISKDGDMKIEKNCVMTVEPGIYIPGFGGVRIEDTILVTENGVERLTQSTKELISV